MTGGIVEVPVGSITGVREDKWFLGSFRGNRLNLIVQTGEGAEVGFMVADHAAWMETMRALASAH